MYVCGIAVCTYAERDCRKEVCTYVESPYVRMRKGIAERKYTHGREISSWVRYPGGSSGGCLTS